MKRHREIMFGDDKDKPISIIITTLAARPYERVLRRGNSQLFFDILTQIVDEVPEFIKDRGGVKWVSNPVQPNENFVDKWQINKLKEENFYKWHATFRAAATWLLLL